MRLPSATVDEVKQLVRTKLLVSDGARAPRLAEYSARGDLRSWVGVIATREALSLLRRGAKTPLPAEDVLVAAASPMTGPELGFLKDHYRDEFRAAFVAALGELEPRERNVLRHHYVHGLTIDEIGTMYGIHRSNAARRIGKAREQLLSATRRRLVLGLKVDRREFDSIMRLIESRIDVSIQRMLGPDEPHGQETR
jgi:RNA polymerase sigma-70 factor (ECF subfamily)